MIILYFCVCLCICVCVCVCIYICMYVYKCVCVYIYVYTCLQNKQRIMQLLTTPQLMPSQSLSCGCQSLSSGCYPNHLPAVLQFFHLMIYGMEYPFGQFRSAVLVLSPPSSLGFSCPVAVRVVQETENVLGSAQHCSATIKIWCVISAVFLLKSKCSIIPGTVKKIDSVPTETGT